MSLSCVSELTKEPFCYLETPLLFRAEAEAMNKKLSCKYISAFYLYVYVRMTPVLDASALSASMSFYLLFTQYLHNIATSSFLSLSFFFPFRFYFFFLPW